MKWRYKSKIGRIVELTQERKEHILEFHPDVESYLMKIPSTLESPDKIRRSRHNPEVLLFYKYFPEIRRGKYFVAVAKVNERSFILTCYLTDKIMTGETIYEKNKKSN